MSPVTFEHAIPASKWPQTHALGHTAMGIGTSSSIVITINACQNKPLERVIHYLIIASDLQLQHTNTTENTAPIHFHFSSVPYLPPSHSLAASEILLCIYSYCTLILCIYCYILYSYLSQYEFYRIIRIP